MKLVTGALLVLLSGMALAYADSPSIVAPPDIVAEAEWFFTGIDLGIPAVDAGPTHDVTNNAPSLFQVGVTTVTWVVQDGAGGRAVDTQTVTVRDTTSPVCPPDAGPLKTDHARPGKRTAVEFEMDIVDAADLDLDISSSPKSGSKFPIGNHTVTFTATDDSGNDVQCTGTVLVQPVSVENLRLVPTHSSISSTWDMFMEHTGYTLRLDSGGSEVQSAKIRGTSHTFYDLEPGTEYTLTVEVRGDKRIMASSNTSTLPPPAALRDDFASAEGWTHVQTVFRPGGYNNYVFAIDDAEGNPDPSARISGDGNGTHSRIERQIDLDGDRESLFVGVQYKSETSLYASMTVKSDGGQTKYLRGIWINEPGWGTSLGDVSGVIGDADRITVQLFLHDPDGAGGQTVHFDNLYVSAAPPPPKYQGGSDSTTPEQDEFDRVLSQMLDGTADPADYVGGPGSLGQYDGLLESVLSSLGMMP